MSASIVTFTPGAAVATDTGNNVTQPTLEASVVSKPSAVYCLDRWNSFSCEFIYIFFSAPTSTTVIVMTAHGIIIVPLMDTPIGGGSITYSPAAMSTAPLPPSVLDRTPSPPFISSIRGRFILFSTRGTFAFDHIFSDFCGRAVVLSTHCSRHQCRTWSDS
jgi:hypothetical protein